MTTARVLSNAVVKPLYQRRRPPAEWMPEEDLEERPDMAAVVVAAQRVHHGAHYPSCAAAGAVIGPAAAAQVRGARHLLW